MTVNMIFDKTRYLALMPANKIPDKLREILAQLHERSKKEEKKEQTDEGGGE